VADEVHAEGGAIAPQLWHVGAVRSRDPEWNPAGGYDSPSGLSSPGKKFGEGMSEEAVADAIDAFARAAADAKRLGFETVELHGAHGYLIDQFFWDGTNEREDAYGSKDLPGRARFAGDILRAVRKAVGPDYPVIIRISQWKQQDFTEFEGSDLNFAGWAKKLTGVPTITVGSVGLSGEFVASYAGEASQPASIDDLLRRLEAEEFDLVAVGRALLQDPNWAVKIHQGRNDELMNFERTAMASLS
jgi:2,4-dienoyl-CoA reductase-like NADH-dependent reductase (Old Yellow Enzyme family)